MKLKRFLILSICCLLVFNSTVFDSHAIVDTFTVNLDIKREFNKASVVLDAEVATNNDVEITYTITPESVPASVVPDETPPKEVVLVIDKSGSMQWDVDGDKIYNWSSSSKARINIVKAAAKNFMTNISANSNIKVGIVGYSSSATVYSDLTDASGTTNSTYFENKIDSISAGGGTNIGDGIRKAYYMLGGVDLPNGADLPSDTVSDTSKFIILLTDGQPTVYTANSRDNDDYLFTESGGYSESSNSDGKSYATEFASKLNSSRIAGYEKKYFVAFSNAGNDLQSIAGNINDYKKAVTADDINNIYQDISYQIAAQVSASSVSFVDILPEGLTFISGDSRIVPDGRRLEADLGTVVYNLEGDMYVAEPITMKIIVRASMTGDYKFDDNESMVSYRNVDNERIAKPFSTTDIINYSIDPIKNVDVIRNNHASGNPENKFKLTWDLYSGAEKYKIYKEKPDGTDELVATIDDANTNEYEYIIDVNDDDSTPFKVVGELSNGQPTGAGTIDANTNPSILNLKVERENNTFIVTWDPVDGATGYNIRPQIRSTMGLPDSTPSHFTLIGGKVRYEYELLDPTTYTSFEDVIKFHVDGTKTDADIIGDISEEISLKQLVKTVITSNLKDYNYAKVESTEVGIKVDDNLPDGINLFDPVLKVKVILPENTNVPLEFTYPILKVDSVSDSFDANNNFIAYNNINRIQSTVSTLDTSATYYIKLNDYAGKALPKASELRLKMDFAIAFDSDDTGKINSAIVSQLRTYDNSIELYQIENNIERILTYFYTTKAASEVNNDVYNTKEMIQIQTSVMYNTTEKVIADDYVRDETVGFSTKYIEIDDITTISDEF